jgi:hypothetical protein
MNDATPLTLHDKPTLALLAALVLVPLAAVELADYLGKICRTRPRIVTETQSGVPALTAITAGDFGAPAKYLKTAAATFAASLPSMFGENRVVTARWHAVRVTGTHTYHYANIKSFHSVRGLYTRRCSTSSRSL